MDQLLQWDWFIIGKKKIENYGDTTVTNDTVKNNKNENIDDAGVVDEPLPEKNNDDDATVNDNTVYTNRNMNIDDVGVADESLSEQNNDDDVAVNDDNTEKSKSKYRWCRGWWWISSRSKLWR